MKTINDRIEMLVNDKCKGNKTAFAKAIGIPPTAMSNYLGSKRRSKPSIDIIKKIITNFKVDPYWLIVGELPSQKTKITGDNIRYNGTGSNNNNTTTNNYHISNNKCNKENDGTVVLYNDKEPEKEKSMEETINTLRKLLTEKDRIIASLEVTVKCLSDTR